MSALAESETPAGDGPAEAEAEGAPRDEASAGVDAPADAAEAPVSAAEDPLAEDLSVEGIMNMLRQARVGELLLSTVSTLASVAYGKLEEGDLVEAKLAIDAIGALVPVLTEGLDAGIVRDLEQALTQLRLAYTDSIPKRQ